MDCLILENKEMYVNNKIAAGYTLNDKEYGNFCDIVYRNAGISLGDNKKELVHARVSKILRKREIGSFKEYIDILQKDTSGNELVSLLDAISTNVTHFFREEPHFTFLADTIKANGLQSGLRIWSAGCSSGEEPYSIAITLKEHRFVDDIKSPPYILATDLSTKVLKKAVQGVFPFKTVERIERSILKKYFLRGKNNSEHLVKLKPEIARMVTFQRLNFIEDFHFSQPFDFIFCRNVMIYFDRETRETLVGRFYNELKPGGYLIIGHSESLNGINHSFKYIKPTIYRKQ